MTFTALPRRLAAIAGTVLLAMLLAGCMLTSETSLVDPSEGEAMFEEALVFAAYNDVDGVLTVSDDSLPGDFAYSNGGYVAPDGSMTVYFLPPPDGGNYLMLAIAVADGVMYGTAHRDISGVTELRLVFGSGLEDKASLLPPDVDLADGGIRVASRADLDAIIPLIADGTLPISPLVAYIGGDTPPRTVVRDGDAYRPGE